MIFITPNSQERLSRKIFSRKQLIWESNHFLLRQLFRIAHSVRIMVKIPVLIHCNIVWSQLTCLLVDSSVRRMNNVKLDNILFCFVFRKKYFGRTWIIWSLEFLDDIFRGFGDSALYTCFSHEIISECVKMGICVTLKFEGVSNCEVTVNEI